MKFLFSRYILNLMILLLGFSFTFTGCSTVEPSLQNRITTIIIKNNTGKFIQKVSISEITPDGRGKHGSISPLPAGTQQVYGRGNKAKPLSDTLLVQWIYNNNTAYKKEVSISLLLNSFSNTNKTIIFEVSPTNTLNVYKESTSNYESTF